MYFIFSLPFTYAQEIYRGKINAKISTRTFPGTSLGVQWLRFHLPMHGMQVKPLVGELRSQMPWGKKKKKKKRDIKQKQYCNKFTKDFKKWSTSKKT